LARFKIKITSKKPAANAEIWQVYFDLGGLALPSGAVGGQAWSIRVRIWSVTLSEGNLTIKL
jgi:hypothetical protein